ncbi:coatomer WD associated region-domain-containing protein [Pisolithus orientalis]|uniref:coatomer WD associated region-domain-containing protein n=1 Tax=Pisolithus orientalis TaxID=936130 RepID=UPI0022248809|nr:coatomer WD associated region-domain-containing protein [Pisolithus orientalis]KAI5987739.1 coatomer WD associated region-domain-containing protein [Pisolithus orientalis]
MSDYPRSRFPDPTAHSRIRPHPQSRPPGGRGHEHIYAYTLSLNAVEYRTAVLRGDMDSAAEILPSIPKEQLNKVARFSEARGLIALRLDDLDITRSVPEAEAESKWKALGDRALAVWRFDLAKQAFERAGDFSSLMFLLLAVGDVDGLRA